MAGISSNGAKLEYSDTGSETFTKLFDIKGIPEMIGKAKKISTTTCSDKQETSINGIKGEVTPEFTGNYNETEYAAAVELEGKTKYWKLTLPDKSTISWQGEVSMGLPSKGYDDVMEMTATISTQTVPTWTKKATV